MTLTGGNASAGAREASTDGEDVEPSDHEEMLETLDVAIDEARRKVDSGRVRSAENERVRIKWIRCLAYAINVRRQVVVDRDLEELTKEVEKLKEIHGEP